MRSGELAKHFGVSDMTIRRDLERCEQQGWIQRCYGGAVLTVMKKRELEFEQRRGANHDSKEHLAVACAGLVEEGMTVFLGEGTTLYEVAQKLRPLQRLTIFTNDIQIAYSMLSGAAELHVVGGLVQKYTGRVGGQTAMQNLWDRRFDVAFCGTNAISGNLEVLAPTAEQANFARVVQKNAGACYLVADRSKFRREARHKILPLDKFSGVVTDYPFSPEEEVLIRQRNIHVIPVETRTRAKPSHGRQNEASKRATIG